MTQTNRTIIICIVVIAILILGYFAWKERGTSVPPSATATSSVIDPIDISKLSTTSISGPGYTITPIYATSSNIKAPDYIAPLTFSASVSADDRASLQSQFAQAQAAIKTNANNFDAWILLGDIRKDAGDYSGAAADWQYMSALYPTNVVSNANLADLYTNYTHEYAKAAAAYKLAIKNDSTRPDLYMDLFQLYTDQYPQTPTVAEAVLKQGIAANPGAADLQAALTTYESAHQ